MPVNDFLGSVNLVDATLLEMKDLWNDRLGAADCERDPNTTTQMFKDDAGLFGEVLSF